MPSITSLDTEASYYIKNVSTGHYVDHSAFTYRDKTGDSHADDTVVSCVATFNSDAQKWSIESTATAGHYTIKEHDYGAPTNEYKTKKLKPEETVIKLDTSDNASDGIEWAFDGDEKTLVVEISGDNGSWTEGTTDDGDGVLVKTATHADNQKWKLIKVEAGPPVSLDDATYYIKNVVNGKFADHKTSPIKCADENKDSQKWKLKSVGTAGEGNYQIINEKSTTSEITDVKTVDKPGYGGIMDRGRKEYQVKLDSASTNSWKLVAGGEPTDEATAKKSSVVQIVGTNGVWTQDLSSGSDPNLLVETNDFVRKQTWQLIKV